MHEQHYVRILGEMVNFNMVNFNMVNCGLWFYVRVYLY